MKWSTYFISIETFETYTSRKMFFAPDTSKMFIIAVSVMIHLLLVFISHSQALKCYQCPRTTAETGGMDANIKCLREGSEVTCPAGLDRCYTVLSGTSRNEVTKGCRRNRECTQNIVCCANDFCNAGLGLYPQTGYGKPCQSVADCVQGITDMQCQTVDDGTNQKLCTCLDSSYNIRATCVQKKSLRDPCSSQNECRGDNTDCNGEMCVCKLGYMHMNSSDTCQSDNGDSIRPSGYSFFITLLIIYYKY